jgi:hypothetical protein
VSALGDWLQGRRLCLVMNSVPWRATGTSPFFASLAEDSANVLRVRSIGCQTNTFQGLGTGKFTVSQMMIIIMPSAER